MCLYPSIFIWALATPCGMIYEGSDSGYGFQPANAFVIFDDEVKMPVDTLTHEAQFYTYNSDGVEIRVFALLGSDEEPRVAFDASETAYSEKKGFRQNGDKMVANAGNWEFDIDSIGVEAMNNDRAPAYLPWEYCCDGDNVAIKIADLEAHRYMFD